MKMFALGVIVTGVLIIGFLIGGYISYRRNKYGKRKCLKYNLVLSLWHWVPLL